MPIQHHAKHTWFLLFLVIGKVIKHNEESVTGPNYKTEDKWS